MNLLSLLAGVSSVPTNSIDPLRRCKPWLILQVWRQYARFLIERGHASDYEIAQLNQIALLYGERTGKQVTLSR